MSSQPSSVDTKPDPTAEPSPFPDDSRVYFSKESNTWRLETEDGRELEYNQTLGIWSAFDEEAMRMQQAAYSIQGVDEEAPAAPVLKRNKKRKEPEDFTSATSSAQVDTTIKRGRASKKDDVPTNGNADPSQKKSKNTAVYVTNLPLDTTRDELEARFSRCGVLEEDDNGDPKVKMYYHHPEGDGDEEPEPIFTGEALVVYFKEESVDLATTILDEAELRIGEPSTVMKVKKAEFGHKERSAGVTGNGGPPKKKAVDKKKTTKRIGKMQRKVQEWDDEDGFGPSVEPGESASSTQSLQNVRVVVLKYMFTLEELKKDVKLLLELKEDVRDECSSLGEVTNVVVYDKDPDGVMTVKFKDPVSAQACLLKMNGRFFDGRRIEASLYSGKQRFKRSGGADEVDGESEEAEKKRLDDFADWLMNEED